MTRPKRPAASPRRIEYMLVRDLKPDPENAKLHAGKDIADSFARFGFVEPITLDERTGYIISGHGRTEALTKAEAGAVAFEEAPPAGIRATPEGWMAPVVRGWASKDDDDALAASIALNTLVAKGGWEDGQLIEILDGLNASDAGLSGLGFSTKELDDLIARYEEAHPPEAQGDWASQYGDRQVRSIILDFTIDDFRFVADTAGQARQALGVDSNAELFLALLTAADDTASNVVPIR